jgi:hypothetical protein
MLKLNILWAAINNSGDLVMRPLESGSLLLANDAGLKSERSLKTDFSMKEYENGAKKLPKERFNGNAVHVAS